jgi:glycosyltransferase involved in cell wall biosynthesis
VVATIHDLSFEHLPETFKRRSRAQLRLTVRRTARQAAAVIAPSEFSRRDLVETYHLPPERVRVTPLAAAPHFAPVRDPGERERIRELYRIRPDYILAVGAIQPRKNLVRLVEAYADLRHRRSQAKLPQLVVVGKRGWLYRETLDVARRLSFEGDIHFAGYVPESDLPALYTDALCFVYPSYFEGFGLPPLEAMQCGAPVIAGNRTSLPEVVGEAGLLVDPFDREAIAYGLGRLIDDKELREELSARGLERSRSFHWRETARLTLEVYEQAALLAGGGKRRRVAGR